LAACHDAGHPAKQRVIGLIEPSRTTLPVILTPTEVRAGERFVVTVNTVGSSDCTTADGGDAKIAPDLIRLVPYDIVPLPGHVDVPGGLCAAASLLPPDVEPCQGLQDQGGRPASSTDPTALDSAEAPSS
jgi:hypothetical protein